MEINMIVKLCTYSSLY